MGKSDWLIVGITIIVALLAAILALQIADFSTTCSCDSLNDAHDTQVDTSCNNARSINSLKSAPGDSSQRLGDIFDDLSDLHNTSTTTANMTGEIRQIAEELSQIPNLTSLYPHWLPKSCQEIRYRQPSSKSGVYQIRIPSNGKYTSCSRYVYCRMGSMFGIDGGWTQVDRFNSLYEDCPPGTQVIPHPNIKVCGRPENSGPGCTSIRFPTYGLRYTDVVGVVHAYQYGAPDADEPPDRGGRNNINDAYIDGISITRNPPHNPLSRTHIWSLMADNSDYHCPCKAGRNGPTLPFIGHDYYCEAGNPNSWTRRVLYPDNLLWDGQGCEGPDIGCCTIPKNRANRPWFYKRTGFTTDDFELRLCDDQGTDDEGVPFSQYEIYVK